MGRLKAHAQNFAACFHFFGFPTHTLPRKPQQHPNPHATISSAMSLPSVPTCDGAAAAPAEAVLDWAQIEKETLSLVEQRMPRPLAVPLPRQSHKPEGQYKRDLAMSMAALTEQVARSERSGRLVPSAPAAGAPCPAPDEAAAAGTIPPADDKTQRAAPSLPQDNKITGRPRHHFEKSDHPAAQDGTRALLCLLQYSRHQQLPLHQQYGLDQFRALIDSNLLFDSIGRSKEEALVLRVAELESRAQELEKQVAKPVLPPPPPLAADGESSRVLHLERALHKVSGIETVALVGFFI